MHSLIMMMTTMMMMVCVYIDTWNLEQSANCPEHQLMQQPALLCWVYQQPERHGKHHPWVRVNEW